MTIRKYICHACLMICLLLCALWMPSGVYRTGLSYGYGGNKGISLWFWGGTCSLITLQSDTPVEQGLRVGAVRNPRAPRWNATGGVSHPAKGITIFTLPLWVVNLSLLLVAIACYQRPRRPLAPSFPIAVDGPNSLKPATS